MRLSYPGVQRYGFFHELQPFLSLTFIDKVRPRSILPKW